MKKPVFYATCPCCGEKLQVDMRLRRIDAIDRAKAKKPTLLDQAPEVIAQDEAKREDKFEEAFDEETRRKKPTLDDFL